MRSRPQQYFKAGETFSYELDVASKSRDLDFEFDMAPEGMRIGSGGRIEWDVPARCKLDEARVRVRILDKGGQKRIHQFQLRSPTERRRQLIAATRWGGLPHDLRRVLADQATETNVPPSGIIGPVDLGDGGRFTYELAGEVTDVDVGGDGRYLVLAFPKQRRLDVFDVNARRVIGSLATSGDRFEYAAGMEKLVVVDSRSGAMTRWDLQTLEREAEAKLTLTRPLWFVEMGSASRGPWE